MFTSRKQKYIGSILMAWFEHFNLFLISCTENVININFIAWLHLKWLLVFIQNNTRKAWNLIKYEIGLNIML